MIWHGDEIHFRVKAPDANGVKVKPFFVCAIVKDEFRVVGNVPLNICGAQKAFLIFEGIIFPSMHVDFCAGKIRQAAAMVEVHVRKQDVFDILGLISKPLHLMDRRFVRIERHICDDAKEFCKPGRVSVIAKTKTGIHKSKPLIRFNKQADRTCFPIVETGIAGETVKQMNGHGDI